MGVCLGVLLEVPVPPWTAQPLSATSARVASAPTASRHVRSSRAVQGRFGSVRRAEANLDSFGPVNSLASCGGSKTRRKAARRRALACLGTSSTTLRHPDCGAHFVRWQVRAACHTSTRRDRAAVAQPQSRHDGATSFPVSIHSIVDFQRAQLQIRSNGLQTMRLLSDSQSSTRRAWCTRNAA